MTKWQEVRLGDICIQITDGTHNTVKDCESGDCYLLSCKNIKNGNIEIGKNERKIDRHTLEELRKRTKTAKGDVLLSSVGTIGETAVIKLENPNYEFQRSVAIFKPNLNFITSEFLYYSLNSRKDILQHSAEGAVQQCLFINPLKDFSIPLPPLDVQKKIAGVLGALDDKIELNNRINNNLEQQGQALFKSWFVDFEPFGGKMPDDWKVGNLLDIADYLNGLAMQKFRPAENDKGLPVLKIKELRQGFCDSNSELCSLNVKNEYIVNDGDVIFSWSGSLLVDFWCGGKCGLNQHLFKVTSKNFDKWFYFLWTKHYLEHFAFIAADKATTMGHIKREELEKAKVIIPSSECYQKMKQIMTPIYDLLISNRVENTRLLALRDTLLPKLMSGEIDVSNVDISGLSSIDKSSFTEE